MPQFTTPDGAQLHYEEKGSANSGVASGCGTILFLHGVWMSGKFFHKQLDLLSKTHHVIALDFRGHGRSSHIHTGHTMAQYARDVHAFIQGMNLQNVALAGWSMGTFVVLDYISQFGSQHLKAAILIEESTSDYKWPDWPIGFIDFPGLYQMMKDIQTDYPAVASGFIPLMFKNPLPQEDFNWMLAEITRLPPTIASCVLYDQTVQDYRPVLPKVTLPTLLCFGRDEKLIPVAAGEYLQKHIPTSELVVFENSSHCPFLEEPELFNKTIADYLAGL
jgi:non-heme chloroperoxidase